MKMYCTLDTETVGGAAKPKGIYHLGGIIHDSKGNIKGSFNYLISEFYDEIKDDDYAKKNFEKYEQMIENGIVTMVATEDEGIEAVESLLQYFNVFTMTAFNSGFDFCKTKCRSLIENREFIDLFLTACQTLACKKQYANFCKENNILSKKKTTVAVNAQAFYAFLSGNPQYAEEHTAWEDSRIELEIFKACMNTHKKMTRNCHFFDFENKWDLIPKIK